jgi:hypothetical protein
LAFFDSSLSWHFWPFTEVLGRIWQFVTRKDASRRKIIKREALKPDRERTDEKAIPVAIAPHKMVAARRGSSAEASAKAGRLFELDASDTGAPKSSICEEC